MGLVVSLVAKSSISIKDVSVYVEIRYRVCGYAWLWTEKASGSSGWRKGLHAY